MLLLFLLIGFAAGLLSGLFGIGGGIVIVPALALGMKFQQQRAVGTSIAALLLPVGILAAYEYWKGGNIDVRGAALIAVGITVGAGVTARFAQGLAPLAMQRAFAVLLVVMAVRMWFKAA
ncbi:MAG TPA: sulfite exporter TauE/SafE family protein [Gemmatimonadales bacterium]|jgi:hypothetical protein|nr:sulfite exporter TauE/SafE family protein [Gemmatimonadales bacterium]